MDIATHFDAARFACDYALAAGQLANGDDLKTAILISLFTDRRARDDDTLPDPRGSRRGWWGDATLDQPLGSRLWLLGREKQLREVLARAREYAEEALAWLVSDGVARRVTVAAEITHENGRRREGWLGLAVTVERPAGGADTYRFDFAWSA